MCLYLLQESTSKKLLGKTQGHGTARTRSFKTYHIRIINKSEKIYKGIYIFSSFCVSEAFLKNRPIA